MNDAVHDGGSTVPRILSGGYAAVLATVAVVILAGFNPGIVLSTIDAPWIDVGYRSVQVSLAEVDLLVVATIVAMAPRRTHFPPRRERLQSIVGLVLVTTVAFSAVTAIAPVLSVARALQVAAGVAFLWAVDSWPDLKRWLVLGCIGLVVLELPIVLLQELTQSTFPLHALAPGSGADVPASAPGAWVVVGPSGGRWERGQGSFLHPNILGGFDTIAIVLLLPRLVERKRVVWIVLAAWLCAWVELALTFSRAAALAAIVGCAVWVVATIRRPSPTEAKRWIGSLILIALLAGLSLAGRAIVTGTPAKGTDPAITDRFALARIAASMVVAHPLLGVGAGNFTLAELGPPTNANYVDPVHVVPLLVAAEAGIPAGLAWIGLVLAPVYVGWRSRRRDGIRLRHRIAISAVVLTLAALDHYLWSFASGRTMFWIALGAGVAE